MMFPKYHEEKSTCFTYLSKANLFKLCVHKIAHGDVYGAVVHL